MDDANRRQVNGGSILRHAYVAVDRRCHVMCPRSRDDLPLAAEDKEVQVIICTYPFFVTVLPAVSYASLTHRSA